MKSRLISAFGLLSCLLATALAQTPMKPTGEATGTPKLAIAAISHNLGGVKKGQDAKHTFLFKNEGTGDLEIKGVAPS